MFAYFVLIAIPFLKGILFAYLFHSLDAENLRSLVVRGREDDVANLRDGNIESDIRVARECADTAAISCVKDPDSAIHGTGVDHRLGWVANHTDNPINVVKFKAEVTTLPFPYPNSAITRSSYGHSIASTE